MRVSPADTNWLAECGRWISRHRALVALIAIIVFFGSSANGFLTLNNFANVLAQSSPIGLVALGMTFVILTGHIDLSVGAVVALAGVGFALLDSIGVPLLGSIAGAMAIGVICGMGSGVMTANCRLPSFIATLGMMSICRGGALMATGGRSVSDLSSAVTGVGSWTLIGLSMPAIALIFIYAVSAFLFPRLVWGRYVTAIGGNATVAYYSGVPVNRIVVSVFALCGLLSGLAGAALTSRLQSAHPLAGSLYELDAIAAVVIGGGRLSGGQGSITGTFLGVLIVASLRNGMSMLNVPSYPQQILIGCVLISSLLLDVLQERKND